MNSSRGLWGDNLAPDREVVKKLRKVKCCTLSGSGGGNGPRPSHRSPVSIEIQVNGVAQSSGDLHGDALPLLEGRIFPTCK